MEPEVEAQEQLWRRIEGRLRRQAPPQGPILATGVSEQAIEEVEREVGGILPEDVRASYRLRDGGFSLARASPRPRPGPEGLVCPLA
jgi:cell wall assembly regulator SMI1